MLRQVPRFDRLVFRNVPAVGTYFLGYMRCILEPLKSLEHQRLPQKNWESVMIKARGWMFPVIV